MKVAIYGCGQLARMMAEAAHSLGVSVCFLAEPNEDTRCVEHFGTVIRIAKRHFLGCQILTLSR
jgi:5-(carboxyamino)imidazole ribonucleotide synthase